MISYTNLRDATHPGRTSSTSPLRSGCARVMQSAKQPVTRTPPDAGHRLYTRLVVAVGVRNGATHALTLRRWTAGFRVDEAEFVGAVGGLVAVVDVEFGQDV